MVSKESGEGERVARHNIQCPLWAMCRHATVGCSQCVVCSPDLMCMMHVCTHASQGALRQGMWAQLH